MKKEILYKDICIFEKCLSLGIPYEINVNGASYTTKEELKKDQEEDPYKDFDANMIEIEQ